jgi:hypothetical protein
VALALGLPRPDWAAVACAAVLVHDATRTTVRRAGHRAVGTAAGIGVAGVVLAIAPGALALVVLVVVFQFVVELIVARNYTAAVVFITPLALLQGALASGQLDGPVAGLLAGAHDRDRDRLHGRRPRAGVGPALGGNGPPQGDGPACSPPACAGAHLRPADGTACLPPLRGPVRGRSSPR